MQLNKKAWTRIWAKFSQKMDKLEALKTCPCCGAFSSGYPDWEKQMKMIEKIVNKELIESKT